MHNFMNTAKAIQLGNTFWEKTSEYGLLDIVAQNTNNGQLIQQFPLTQ